MKIAPLADPKDAAAVELAAKIDAINEQARLASAVWPPHPESLSVDQIQRCSRISADHKTRVRALLSALAGELKPAKKREQPSPDVGDTAKVETTIAPQRKAGAKSTASN